MKNKTKEEIMSNGNTLAQATLKKHWNGKIPVDIAAITKQHNIKLHRFTAPNGVRGKMDVTKDSVTIFYDNDNPQYLNRFIVAHLLGKYLMNSGSIDKVTVENVSKSTSNALDHQANEFALELLIPTKTITAYMQNMYLTDIDTAAEMFAVAPVAMGNVMSRVAANFNFSAPQVKQPGLEEDILEIAGVVIAAKFGM